MSDQQEVRLGPIRRHPQVCHGELTFTGTRVFVDSLFELLGAVFRIDEVFGAGSEYFPTVSVVQAKVALELAVEVLEVISADPALLDAVRRTDLDLAALLDEDWPKDTESLRSALGHWSDALQRRIHVPPGALWVMANLAHEADLVRIEEMTADLSGWLYRAERMVADIVGVESWHAATRALLIPEQSRQSLEAYLQRLAADEIPGRLANFRGVATNPDDTQPVIDGTAQAEAEIENFREEEAVVDLVETDAPRQPGGLQEWLAEMGIADLDDLEHHRCRAHAETMEEHTGFVGPSPRDWGDAIDHVVHMSGVWWAVAGSRSAEYVTPIRYCPWCGARLLAS